MRRGDSPEQIIRSFLHMRDNLRLGEACESAQIALNELGHDYDAPLWERFFDKSNAFDEIMFELGCEFWSFDWRGQEAAEAQVALLAFEAAKGAGSIPAAFALAQAFDWLGDERSEGELREFIALHPEWENPRLYGILGGLIANRYDDQEHMREALNYLDQVGDMEPQWVQWRALATAKLGSRDEAIALLEDQLLTDDPDVLRVLGDIHAASGESFAARSAYLRAVAAGDGGAARRLGIEFLEEGDLEGAVQAFAVAGARGDIFSVKEINRIGLQSQQDGLIDKALDQFALGWEIGDLESGFDLALTLERLGRVSEARVLWYQMADGGDVAAMLRFAILASSQGDLAIARDYFHRALEIGSVEQRALAAGNLGLTYDVTAVSDPVVDVRGLLEHGSIDGDSKAQAWLDDRPSGGA